MLIKNSDGTYSEVAQMATNELTIAKRVAQTVASDMAANAGVTNLGNGRVINLLPVPPSFSFISTSNNEAGSGTVTNYIFNTTDLNPSTTTNGSGAASIVNTYGDGFSGKGYEQLIRVANNGQGVKILGFTIKSVTYGGAVLDSTFFTAANLKLILADLQNGGAIPQNVNLDMAVRNTMYKDGILTILFPFYLNALAQLSYSHPKNVSLYWTFFTEASGFQG